MIQKSLKKKIKNYHGNIMTIIIISIIIVILSLIFVFGTNKDDNDNNEKKSVNNVSESTTVEELVTEKSTNKGSAFEEEEALEAYENVYPVSESKKNNSGNPVAKDFKKVTKQNDNLSKTKGKHGVTNKGTTDKSEQNKPKEETTKKPGQSTTEKETIALPPKASNQNGEWGNAVKN